MIKMQIIEILSCLCMYSDEGYQVVDAALQHYKVTYKISYTYSYTLIAYTLFHCMLHFKQPAVATT